jgi:phospholipid transport system substrate-binding protein
MPSAAPSSAKPVASPSGRLAGIGLALALALAGAAAGAQPTLAQASRQHAAPDAEQFVQTEASKALSILRNPSTSAAAKSQAFNGFINQVADLPRITDFVLGRYRRSLTPTQYNAFTETFRAYTDSVYQARLSDYQGDGLHVTGSVSRTPSDVVVTSLISGAEAKGEAAQLNWRVLRGDDGRWRVVDVQAEGVWLAVVEQQDFTSTLANHNGDINLLIGQLRADAGKGQAIGRSK